MIGTGTILRTAWALMAGTPRAALIAFIALTLPFVAIDAFALDGRLALFGSLIVLFAEFMLTSAALRHAGAHHAWGKPGRVASYIGLGIVTSIAVGFGFLLLIVPGLFLYARWSTSLPLVVGEARRMGDAMEISWHRTARHTTAIMGALALPIGLWAAGLLLVMFAYPEYGPVPLPETIAANALVSAGLVGCWYLAVAVHLCVAPEVELAGSALPA